MAIWNGHPGVRMSFHVVHSRHQISLHGFTMNSTAILWSPRLGMSFHVVIQASNEPSWFHHETSATTESSSRFRMSFHVVIQTPNEPLWLHWNVSGHRMVIQVQNELPCGHPGSKWALKGLSHEIETGYKLCFWIDLS
jgi:hypothetical protein